MSGIASLTSRAVAIARDVNPEVRISATRKTLWPVLDKKAIVAGGGDSHRLGQFDMILIKSNFLREASSDRKPAAPLIQKAKDYAGKMKEKEGAKIPVEVEASTPQEAVEAAKAGVDIVMLDNFTHPQIEEALQLLEKEGLRKKVKIELSGGISFANLADYAKHKADVISMGALTHSAEWLDVSLRPVPSA